MGARWLRRRARIGVAMPLAGVLASASMMSGTALAAQPHRPSTLAECMAEESAATDYGCYEIKVVSATPSTVVLRMTWDLNSTREGVNNADWKGGLWMQSWPVAGQWPKGQYPKGEKQFPEGILAEDCGSSVLAGDAGSKCYRTFSGASGSLDLEFPASMAGYVYEIQTWDNLCTADRSSCGPSGGALQASSYSYAFILKAFKYKNAKGKAVIGTTCPPASKRSSACTPTLAPRLFNNIGGGSPVPLSSGS